MGCTHAISNALAGLNGGQPQHASGVALERLGDGSMPRVNGNQLVNEALVVRPVINRIKNVLSRDSASLQVKRLSAIDDGPSRHRESGIKSLRKKGVFNVGKHILKGGSRSVEDADALCERSRPGAEVLLYSRVRLAEGHRSNGGRPRLAGGVEPSVESTQPLFQTAHRGGKVEVKHCLHRVKIQSFLARAIKN